MKKKHARELASLFPIDFFELMHEIGDKAAEDTAYNAISVYQKSLIGCFDENKLSKFELLLNHVYRSKKISKEHYYMFVEWLKEEQKCMEDNIICKDVNKRTFYGFAYQDENGVIKYVVDASRGIIYQKKFTLEQKNIYTTPVYSETYFANFNTSVPQMMAKFKEEIYKYFDEKYLGFVGQLTMNNKKINIEEFNKYIKYAEKNYGKDAKNTLIHYGHRWGILR